MRVFTNAKDPPAGFCPRVGRTGQAPSLTAEASVSSRIRDLSYTAPSPAERWVHPCSGGSLRLGAHLGGLLEDISRKGLGEGLSARPPGTSGGRELQGVWRQASRLSRRPEQPLKSLKDPLAAEKPPGIQPGGVLLCGPAPPAASSSHPAGSTSGHAQSPQGLSPSAGWGPQSKLGKCSWGNFDKILFKLHEPWPPPRWKSSGPCFLPRAHPAHAPP